MRKPTKQSKKKEIDTKLAEVAVIERRIGDLRDKLRDRFSEIEDLIGDLDWALEEIDQGRGLIEGAIERMSQHL